MRTKIATSITVLTVIAVLALPNRVIARASRAAPYPYVLLDLGTFGGPQSSVTGPSVQLLTNSGMVIGGADTPITDTDYPPGASFGPDPYIQHAFVWRQGVKIDLGALPGNNSSYPNWINAQGDVAASSETGAMDPLVDSPAAHAVLWQDGRLIDLGTLGGYESGSLALNDRDQVVGFATNTIPDPFSFLGLGTQLRAFLWQDSHLQDLGTLGGPDAWPQAVNTSGQIAGFSYTSAISNAATGIPTQDPFLWQDGHMHDLGSLGGTISFVSAFNERGQVVGQSDLAGDQVFHPFLWNGTQMIDLGTLGGNYGSTNWINEAGHVAGWATLPGDTTAHAVLWKNGTLLDLGTVPGQPCSYATQVNAHDQVVGGSCTSDGNGNGWLWEDGTLSDLNMLVAPSALHLAEARAINDRGEIAGHGVLPTGDQHAVLLIPAGEAKQEGLTSNAPAPGRAGPAALPQGRPTLCALKPSWPPRLAHGPHLPCRGT
jgi:probable HAF family extracellular repeat protein